MTKKEIIGIASQASKEWLKEFPTPKETAHQVPKRFLEIFAKLVAEKEREACAKIAENRILHDENKDIKKGYLFAQQSIAQDIRARIEK
jgi:hypothetical protein